ncbi:ABC-F family ATP-binding cassette domain-containing protein [Jiella sonneratiae]|uniref:ABC-F family ATP-binding cassette domain-containing protein n=1 Tax=Jiella sonneratiae TaxID=2816856 RepID=A0ABS3J0U0_9HYPH|nr:ABC-F family ATP-binding cassette domain-containing protein [Jiella sonneratiae]MBO0902692.1 ABC-F family ATP-binding cassette domain-containing protein [Jiella sonneratiae]
MPATISLSALSLSTPDGRILSTDLDLTFGCERTGLVGRNGVGKTTLLRVLAGDLPVAAGKVAVGGSVGLLRQAVQHRPGETIADLFGVRAGLAVLRRAEAGTASVDELADADWTLEERVATALVAVGVEAPLDTPLAELSGGQATRVRLAALTFAAPDFLLLDEPTNNLDREGRQAVVALLSGWKGGAVVVSHDRELLETMDAIVELTSLGVARYGGNWSHYRREKALALEAARHDLTDAEKQIAEIDRGAQRSVETKARKDRRGRGAAAKGGMPRIIAGLRKDRSEDSGGVDARITARRRERAFGALSEARERIEILQPFAVTLAPTGLASRKDVLKLNDVSAGYDAAKPILQNVSLSIVGPERVALTGSNGVGKTTLLKLLVGDLQPLSGRLRVTPDVAMLDQTVGLLNPATSILENFRRINPGADANACRASLARFTFRAGAAEQIVGTLSGGEMLRAGLACVLGGPRPPSFLVLDEPTNHLDVASLETIEAGLRAYDGALLIVSHDEAVLDAIGITRRWRLRRSERPGVHAWIEADGE